MGGKQQQSGRSKAGIQSICRTWGNKNSPKLADYAELLYAQALLAEGGQIPDPASFNKKVAELMVGAL